MALHDPAGGDADRPAKPEADGPDAELPDQRRGDLVHLPPDALGAVGRADVGPPQGHELAVFGVAEAELQLRAANFNA